jgi:hypothetical protein
MRRKWGDDTIQATRIEGICDNLMMCLWVGIADKAYKLISMAISGT